MYDCQVVSMPPNSVKPLEPLFYYMLILYYIFIFSYYFLQDFLLSDFLYFYDMF